MRVRPFQSLTAAPLQRQAARAHDPEEAILRAINDTLDNDTVGAIVGAAVGALHGASALPARWRQGLTGRAGPDDDGAMFRMVDAAHDRFWQGSVDAP